MKMEFNQNNRMNTRFFLCRLVLHLPKNFCQFAFQNANLLDSVLQIEVQASNLRLFATMIGLSLAFPSDVLFQVFQDSFFLI